MIGLSADINEMDLENELQYNSDEFEDEVTYRDDSTFVYKKHAGIAGLNSYCSSTPTFLFSLYMYSFIEFIEFILDNINALFLTINTLFQLKVHFSSDKRELSIG